MRVIKYRCDTCGIVEEDPTDWFIKLPISIGYASLGNEKDMCPRCAAMFKRSCGVTDE